MKKTLLGFYLFSSSVFSQVGINTANPKATLDIVGKPTSTTDIDGVIPPRLTGDGVKAKDNLYGSEQNGSIIYITSAVTIPSTKTAMINEQGLYFYDSVQSKWRKLITGVPLNIQAFNGQRITNGSTVVAALASINLDFPQVNIMPTSDIGSWNAGNTTFTVNKKGVYTIFAGTQMVLQSGSASSSGAMTISAGAYSTVGGSQLTLNGTTFTVNCSGTFSLLLNAGEKIKISANSGSNSWTQGASFLHIMYSEI